MTARKPGRPKRTTTAVNLPDGLAAFFASGSNCWFNLLPEYRPMLPGWWQAFAEANPDTSPPAGYEWLADESSPQFPTADQVDKARRVYATIFG